MTAGQTYPAQVRVKATDSSFKSASMTQAVTTVAGDGSTTVKPGESVEVGTDPKTTITNDGEKVTIITGGTTTAVTPAKDVEVGGDGSVTVSGGSTIKPGNGGPEITVGPGNGGTIGGNGEITIPGGGTIKPNPDGTVDVPSGSTVQTGENGPEITVGPGNGGNVGGNGEITVPGGGTVQIGKDPATTITPPTGGEVTPNPDGTVTVPDGTTVKSGNGGPKVTVGPGNGGTIGSNGGVTVGGGETVKVGDTTVTLPEGGGTVKPNPDGTIPLPGGTVVTPTGKDPITVPDGGGTVNPGTGEVTLNVHTVTFDSQGGSAVNPIKVTHGKTAVQPGNPTRSGYAFGGWYKESGYTNAWNFTTDTVTGDITLYAKWTQNSGGGGGGWYNPPSITTYPVTTPATFPHGKLTISPVRAERNATVTITVTPEDGYRLGVLNVTSGGKSIPLTEKGGGKYTFTMPAGTVKVEATFVPAETPGTPWINPFADVPEGAWYYDAIWFVSENGLMGGYGNGNFGPNDPITREQLAVMLWRYSGSPAATNKELHFNDTDEINGFALEALRWAVENDIINGYGDGRLGLQGQATRAQVAQMLMNFLER
ncbi:InlB B-repeat-containing protein [Oscillospiraceae bacterium 38-13]